MAPHAGIGRVGIALEDNDAEEKAQSVKRLSCKHKDFCSVPEPVYKNQTLRMRLLS